MYAVSCARRTTRNVIRSSSLFVHHKNIDWFLTHLLIHSILFHPNCINTVLQYSTVQLLPSEEMASTKHKHRTTTSSSTTMRNDGTGSNVNERNSKRPKTSSMLMSRRRSPRLLEKEEITTSTMSGLLVVLQTDMLPWRDAMKLGVTCRLANETWMITRDVHMRPLLTVLEAMVDGQPEDEREEMFRQFLLDEEYDTMSTACKCKEMVRKIAYMVIHMKCHHTFCLDDPSNRLKNKECDPWEWGLGLVHGNETRFWHKFHRRGTLALNIAIFTYALDALKRGGDCCVNEVFAGMPGARLGGAGHYYGNTICEHVASMFPFRDKDLAKYMRRLYPSAYVLDVLGPTLTEGLVLAQPFFRFLPPLALADEDEMNLESDDDDDDNEEDNVHVPLFQNLPTPLEPMTEEIINNHGMRAWLDPNHSLESDMPFFLTIPTILQAIFNIE